MEASGGQRFGAWGEYTYIAGGTNSTDLPVTAIAQSLSCGPSKYICDPVDNWSNWECEQVCGGSGHCKDYSGAEIAWCATHPDQFYNPYKLCGPSGDPTWRTWCVPGPIP